jgi:hypothetical protein
LDIDNNQKDYFYHHKQVDYSPNLTGKLNISSDKFFQSFKKEVSKIIEKAEKVETLIGAEREARKNINGIFGKLSKRQVELSPQRLHELHKQGFT